MRSFKIILLFFLCAQGLFAQLPFSAASWIAASEDINTHQSPLFRKSFSVCSKIKKATAFICGVGYYNLQLNAKPVSTAVLEQGFTRYDKRLLYKAYDVTGLLRNGENVVGAELGNGWFNFQTLTIWNFDKIAWRKSPRLIFSLKLEYENGKTETINSSDQWKVAYGASQFNSLQSGEIYNANLEISGWNKAGFNDASWKHALQTSSPGGKLELQNMPSVEIIREILPKGFKKLAAGRFLFDMGENFSGVAKLVVSGKKGDTVKLSYGEQLSADGGLDTVHNRGHMVGDLQPEFATDIYVLKGDSVEGFVPKFTYHGFQYVELNCPQGLSIAKQSLSGLFYSTGFKPVGSFSSSSEMLNRLYDAAIRSYRSNFLSIPTDCPQREKMGWLADAHICSEMGLWNFDAASSYRKYLGDIRDVQLENGMLPGVAPTNEIGYHWIDPADPDFGPAWGSALPIISWHVYLYSSDKAVLKENYSAVKKYVDFLNSKAVGNLYNTGLDDFLAIEKTPKEITSSMFLYTDTRLLSKMAAVLDNNADRIKYEHLAEEIKKAFNNKYFDLDTKAYRFSTLTALSGVLYNELCPPSYKDQVALSLAKQLRKKEYKADFGVLGTKWVLSALSDNGYLDDAIALLTNTKAGWGRWMAKGNTTLEEGWDEKEGSRNHVFFGDYAAWYFKALAGLKLDESKPGFKHFSIRPVFPKSLSELAVSHKISQGEIKLSWQRKNSFTEVKISIPKGTDADFLVKGYRRKLRAGYHIIKINN